jgi:outer membrane protein OmpA-like peptidoglycan-associated protein
MALINSKANDSNWMSFSDIMTGLMVIFMFIAISYIYEVQKREAEVNQIIEDYKLTQQKIYNDLDSTFTDRFKEYNLLVNPDLSIQITDASALFPSQFYYDDILLKQRFESFLDEFTPLFYSIILKEEYRDDISEIRIEGHTAIAVVNDEFDKEYYRNMIILSQKRSNKVLEYMTNTGYYDGMNEQEKSFLRFVTTSNGLAFGRSLDNKGNFKYDSDKSIDKVKSKRVEFRIVTNSQKVIDEWIKKTKK